MKSKIAAAVLSLGMLLPASSAFARTHHYRRTHYAYTTHRKHHSQTRGAVVGAVAGAVIDHRHPLTGAILGAAAGDAVQAVRNHHQ